MSQKGLCLMLLAIWTVSVSWNSVAATSYVASNAEWSTYMDKYNKTYTTAEEKNARYYYNYNMALINKHNAYYDRGLRSYKLGPNQFTDILFKNYVAQFPVGVYPSSSNAQPLPNVATTSATKFKLNDLLDSLPVDDQGFRCSSGWAYSSTKAISIRESQLRGTLVPTTYSAQQLIDCAGGANACTTQVPQNAFKYLADSQMPLLLESEYPNEKQRDSAHFCRIRNVAGSLTLTSYAKLNNGDDAAMRNLIFAGYPVVIEYNPASFEFMHYASGVFVLPSSYRGSHYMVVVGFDEDAWWVLNSFGPDWGQQGYMRISRNSRTSIVSNAILPLDIVVV